MNAKHFALAAAALGVAAGCSVTPHAKPATEAAALAPATQPIALHAGDKLELKFFYAPELNDSQTVRPDGNITLNLVGDVPAAGKTAAQLGSDIQTAYGTQLKYPQCTVIVREMSQQKVYVDGEVQHPGLIDLPADTDVMKAIMTAGGFNMTTAATDHVLVIRQVGAKRVGYQIKLEDALRGAEHEMFALQPQDIVFVPRTAITNVDNFVDQYISQVIPKTGFVLFNVR